MKPLFALVLSASGAFGADSGTPLSALPAPVAAYATQFEGECKLNGLGPPVANEMYTDKIFGRSDVNGDGAPDFMAYACMFGCIGAPFAFVAAGLPCTNGVLALSEGGVYRTYSLPGTVSRIVNGPPLRIVTTRMRFAGDLECKAERDCQYVYELKGQRFERVGICPEEGCEVMLRQ